SFYSYTEHRYLLSFPTRRSSDLSIGAYMGLRGNPFGAFLWIIVNLIVLFTRFGFLNLGYSQGAKLIDSASGRLNAITDSAILLGVTVVGALIPTVVNVKVPFVYRVGKVTLKMQTILNQIMRSEEHTSELQSRFDLVC